MVALAVAAARLPRMHVCFIDYSQAQGAASALVLCFGSLLAADGAEMQLPQPWLHKDVAAGAIAQMLESMGAGHLGAARRLCCCFYQLHQPKWLVDGSGLHKRQ